MGSIDESSSIVKIQKIPVPNRNTFFVSAVVVYELYSGDVVYEMHHTP